MRAACFYTPASLSLSGLFFIFDDRTATKKLNRTLFTVINIMQVIQNIIELTPFYITLFWGLVFILNPPRENRARFGLGIFMLTASVVYFAHAVYFTGDYSFYMKIGSLYTLADLSVYPMYYLYIRLLTSDIRFKYSYLWHLLPSVVLAVLLLVLFSSASGAGRVLYFNQVVVYHHWPTGAVSPLLKTMAITYFVSRIVFGIQSVVYLLPGLKLIKKYNKRVANFYSNPDGKRLVWIELLTLTLLVTALASFVANLLGRHFFSAHHLLAIPSFLFSFMFFLIGLLGNKQVHNITHVVKDEDNKEYSTDSAQITPVFVLKEKLLAVMENEALYLDPNFHITSLSEKIFTNRTYLSNMINEEFNMSFSDFVNQYRVIYAKTLMEADGEGKHSLEYFSEKSGFGSISSFNRAFKKFEKISAGSFRSRKRRRAS